MRPSFHPRLINGPFDDPGLFIPFQFKNRALIFDLGDISRLCQDELHPTGFVAYGSKGRLGRSHLASLAQNRQRNAQPSGNHHVTINPFNYTHPK